MSTSSLCRAGLWAALATSGCVGVCPGSRPSCESAFPAARLAVHEGGRWFGPRVVWADAAGQLRGDVEDGSRWSVAALGDHLAIGHPEDGRISLAPIPRGEEFLADAAIGEWSDRALGFATSIGAARPVEAEPYDLWVGAPGAQTYRGEVLRWADAEATIDDEPALRIVGGSPGDEFGGTVLSCGDVSGDGRTDWLASAIGFSGSDSQDAPALAGAAVLIRSDEAEALDGEVALHQAGRMWWGVAPGDGAGEGLACGDDLTGDGRPDLVVGVPWAEDHAGIVYIVSGANSNREGSLPSVAFWHLDGPEPDGWYGSAIATGDFDGDGIADLAVGAPGARQGVGTVLIYDGADIRDRNRGLAPRTTIDLRDTGFAAHLGKVLVSGRIGSDAIDDLVIGVPDWSVPDEAWGLGRAVIFDGAPDWPATLLADEDAPRSVEGAKAFQRVGRNLALADVDGDGADDLLFPTGDKPPP